LNRDFLKKIIQKLQVGNARTIHLNSYPGRYAARLDICDLSHIGNSLPGDFIEKLLSQPSFQFRFKIEFEEEDGAGDAGEIKTNNLFQAELSSPGSRVEHEQAGKDKEDSQAKELNRKRRLVAKRLSSIYYENEDTFLEHGIKTFAFGYPSLIYRSQNDPSKIINAPILLWKLELQRGKNEWIISRDEDSGISINDVLLNFLEQDLNTSGFFSLNEELLSDALIDKAELLKIVNEIADKISNSAQKIEVIPPSEAAIDKEKRSALIHSKGNPQIMFSGIFSLYKTQKEAIIKDVKQILQNIESFRFEYGDDLSNFQKIKYSAVETDPSQRQALKSVGSSKKLIIHGPPGTGKSQTLTAIIANALFNASKCLVVCEKRTAIEVIQKNLSMLGLGSLCGLIEDVNRDRKKIVDSVRESRNSGKYVNENILNSLFVETDEYAGQINSDHKFLGKYILNDLTWPDLTGKFLQMKKSGQNYLKLFDVLKNAGIDFKKENLSEDFNSRASAVKRLQSLFNPVKNEIKVFLYLKDDLFERNSTKESAIEIGNSLKSAHGKLKAQISEVELAIKQYSTALAKHYEDFYQNFNRSINDIAVIYKRNISVNRSLFTSLGGFAEVRLKLLSLFSKKYRQLKTDKELIVPALNKLSEYTLKKYFVCELIPVKESLTEIEPQLLTLKDNLDRWYSGITEFVENDISLFHSGSLNKNAFAEAHMIESLELRLNALLEHINGLDYFAKQIEFPGLPLVSKLKVLYETTAIIESILEKIDCLYEYSKWRNDYIHKDASTQKITDELIAIGSSDWENDFEIWYYFNILLAYENEIALRDDTLFRSLEDNFEKISKYQVDVIKEYWVSRQKQSAEGLEQKVGININTLYNKARNNKFQKRNSLRKIINTDIELFTDYFPVALVNPSVCSSLFEMKEGLFDVVIFDEASQLRTEDVYAAKLRGRHRIVSGDENQMPPSGYFASSQVLIDGSEAEEDDDVVKSANTGLAESESLLEFAIQRGYKETFLDIHYRSKHPDLIEFSNAAFYGSRLSPMPADLEYKAIRYFNVNGVYDQDESVNREEAMKIAALIDELVITARGNENPSVGIATFNIFQRNYLLDLLNGKADRNSIFAEKLNILKNKPGEPFFVKNLENIQGDERDIIIVSTTFGKRADGSFLQNFGPINQEKGFRLLNVIITRAKHMMIVCTSIPEENIMEYPVMLGSFGNRGKGIFYAFLAYAAAIEKNDLKSKQALLSILRSNLEKRSGYDNANKSTIFEEVVLKTLKEALPPTRVIPNYKVGGFKIDIAVLPEALKGRMIAVECDGANYHNSPEAYAWDIFRKKFLESFGFRFVRIWSVNWFNNPERELSKLLSFINEPFEKNELSVTLRDKPMETN
jgi:very-short-patch-repair endonuclease/DNA polymerase III delta prime subunit